MMGWFKKKEAIEPKREISEFEEALLDRSEWIQIDIGITPKTQWFRWYPKKIIADCEEVGMSVGEVANQLATISHELRLKSND